MPTIRPAQPSDWLEFWRFRNSDEYLHHAQNKKKHSTEETEEWFQRAVKDQIILMIECDKGTVGYTRLVPQDDAWVADIIVSEKARGTGAANEAMEELLSRAPGKVITYVARANDRSLAFFDKHNFKITDDIGSHYKLTHFEESSYGA